MTKTFKEFVNDYNEYYKTNVEVVSCTTLEIEEIIDNLYNCNDFEFDDDNETITLYY